MMIKVFKFRVSNATSSPLRDDTKEPWFKDRQKELKSQEEIEAVVNDFLNTTNRVIDIKVNTVDVDYHNNGRGNTIDLIYTVLFE